MAKSVEAVSEKDFEFIENWFNQNKSAFPDSVNQILANLLNNYNCLVRNKKDQKDILLQLRLAMGLLPKSEKGQTDHK